MWVATDFERSAHAVAATVGKLVRRYAGKEFTQLFKPAVPELRAFFP